MKPEYRKLFVNLIRAFVIIIAFSGSIDAYSQNKRVEIPTTPQPSGPQPSGPKPPKPDRRGGIRTNPTAPSPKLTYNKSTKTINYDGWQYQFVVVDGSKFVMGSMPDNPEVSAYGSKAHRVNLETYAIGNFEVPRWLWKAVMGNDPFTLGIVEDDDLGAPVNNVSWNECQTFISKLNKQTGMTFALPTEAQWEYAARGGANKDKTYYSGTNDRTKLPAVANSLGIYSMSGLLKEWCSDWYADWTSDDTIDDICVLNPTGSETGKAKVVRGGSNLDYSQMEVTARDRCAPTEKREDIGLRLVLLLVK